MDWEPAKAWTASSWRCSGPRASAGHATTKRRCAKTAERVGLRHMSVASMKLGQFLPPVWGKQTLLVKPNLEPIWLDLNQAPFVTVHPTSPRFFLPRHSVL